MKTMNEVEDDNSGSNGWLGFSLSPYVNMEVSSDPQAQAPSVGAAVPTAVPAATLFNSPPHLNYGIYYGAEGEHGGLYSSVSVMPLKSDGSLCVLEALTRPNPHHQAIATTSAPKLEDFFGGANMATREAIPLSLDSLFYHQNPSQDLHQQQQIHLQQYQYYSGPRNDDVLSGEQGKETQHADCNLHLPTMADDGLSGMKNWVSRGYSAAHAAEQKMAGCMGDNGTVAYGDLRSLTLSMSPCSQSSCVTVSANSVAMEAKKRGPEKMDQKQIVHRKSIDTFGQRTSQYRGVTRHRWTGRYEAHLWDNSSKKEGQSRKGRQVYLGGYDTEEKAARAYDLAALKYWGPSTHINFPLENYQKELEEMKNMTRQEHVAHLRRKSSGFSRGASMYRGVTRHHQHGRWQARIGRVAGNKDLYLGTFSTQEEAAEAYDIAAIKFRGANAVTNFDISRYDVERIMASNNPLAGELARRSKDGGEKKNGLESDPQWKMVLCNKPPPPPPRSAELAEEGGPKMETHTSNASSLVTSLSSSREDSPDKSSEGMGFIASSWNPQLRPALSLPHVPVFAAWTDA